MGLFSFLNRNIVKEQEVIINGNKYQVTNGYSHRHADKIDLVKLSGKIDGSDSIFTIQWEGERHNIMFINYFNNSVASVDKQPGKTISDAELQSIVLKLEKYLNDQKELRERRDKEDKERKEKREQEYKERQEFKKTYGYSLDTMRVILGEFIMLQI